MSEPPTTWNLPPVVLLPLCSMQHAAGGQRQSKYSTLHANISDTLSSFSKNYLNCSNRQRTKDRYGLRTNDVRVGSVRSLPGQPEERVLCFSVTYDGEDTAMKQEEGETDVREYPCLVRLSDGGKCKFSTRVRGLQYSHSEMLIRYTGDLWRSS